MKQKVQDIVNAFMNDVTSFTSIDVSNLVKREGFPSTRHRQVAEEIRSIYESDFMDTYSYERTLINVTLANGSSKQAFLYHHCTTDPDAYDKRSQVACGPLSCETSSVNPKLRIVRRGGWVAPTTNTSGQRQQKGDCRLEIPASWVRELGWSDGEVIYICGTTRIEVKESANVSVNDNVIGTVSVSGGRLRISKSAFDRSNIVHGPYTSLNVTLLNDHVLIEG
jgi:hypothetical protein